MGKNLIQQKRGKGSPRYRSPSHRFIGRPEYSIPDGAASGIVVNIIDAPGRLTPLAEIEISGIKMLQIPNEGMKIGQQISFSHLEDGSILPLRNIPEGTKIYNIESMPGDGGKICRASGSFSILITREKERCIVLLPSKQKKVLSANCLATIGIAAGSGRTEKPFMKAGTKHYAMKALNRLYPRTRGVAMNPVDHPFGGKGRPGKHKTVKRSMPPGRKVGSVAARRTGKKKRK